MNYSRLVYWFRIFLVFAIMCTAVYYVFVGITWYYYLGLAAGTACIFAAPIASKILKIKIPATLEFAYLIFLVFALFLGEYFEFYQFVKHYDKVVHFISGILSVVALNTIYKEVGFQTKNPKHQVYLLIISGIAVAAVWEIYEFFCDRIFGTDMQSYLKGDTLDTMWDIVMATTSTLMTSFYITRHK